MATLPVKTNTFFEEENRLHNILKIEEPDKKVGGMRRYDGTHS